MRSTQMQVLRLLPVLMVAAALAAVAVPFSRAAELRVIASGLANPRGLAFGSDGALYVVEAGTGGAGPCIQSSEGSIVCLGRTGAVTRIAGGAQHRVVTGIPSLAADDGSGATGAHDITFLAGGDAAVTVGLGAPPALRVGLGADGKGLGCLIRFRLGENWRLLGDVAGFEASTNPDGGLIDSNPYPVVADESGLVVADAGGNSLLHFGRKGQTTTLAVFPNRLAPAPPFLGLPPGTSIPMQAVPTAVTIGPDGAYYVGQLTGFPFQVGGANVYRVVPGQAPEVFAGGFTNIIDIAFEADGSLLVLEIAANGLLSGDIAGALIRIAPNGTRTTIAGEGLVAPTSVAVAADGAIYVSNFGIFPSGGQVVQVIP
jgi:hypothetical protein